MELKPGYKQTEVGVIPEDWEVMLLGDLFWLNGGLSASRDQLSSEGFCYLHYGDIHLSKKTYIDIQHESINIPKLNILLKKVSPNFLLEDGDVVFVDASEDEIGTNKHVVIKNSEKVPFISGLHTIVAKSKTDTLEHLYRRYCFQAENIRPQFRFYAAGTKVLGVSKTNIAKICLPIPSRSEQSAIATALSDTDSLIESLEQLIAKKRLIKQGAMQELLTGKRRLPGFAQKSGYKQTEVGVIPEDWEIVPLGDLAERIVGGGTPSRFSPEFWGNEIPWITVKDFATFDPYSSSEYITPKGLENSASNIIPSGTPIIAARMGVGKIGVYKVNVAINQDLKGIFLRKDIDHLFFFYLFKNNIKNIENLCGGSTVKGISVEDLKKVNILKPPFPEQSAIATVLSDMDEEITSLEDKLSKLRQIKQGMMQELLTGRIRLV